jgi:thymidylate synthase
MSTVYGVSNIRNIFKEKLKMGDFVTDKTGVKTVEIINAAFFANEPSIFGTVNHDYVERELEWYKSMSLNVNDIPGGPPEIWKMVANANGYINSNYGWCIYSQQNGDQYENVLNELIKNPLSRRATMIYNRPTMHDDYNKGGMSDFMCTNAVQYLIRNNKVNALVYMRSNDAVFGYKNDYAWQKHILEQLVIDLRNEWLETLEIGDIYWNVASLHVYERHFKFIDGDQ